jgi:hypothetical protein
MRFVKVIFVIAMFFIFVISTFSQESNNNNLKLKDSKSFKFTNGSPENGNPKSILSVGAGMVNSYVSTDKTYFMASIDFTFAVSRLFYVEAGFDYVKNSFDLVYLIPGLRFSYPNKNSDFKFGLGLGLLSKALYVIPSFKYEYFVSNTVGLGLELKYPLGSSHLSQLHSNLNFVFRLDK